jgi:hypothetical protein
MVRVVEFSITSSLFPNHLPKPAMTNNPEKQKEEKNGPLTLVIAVHDADRVVPELERVRRKHLPHLIESTRNPAR